MALRDLTRWETDCETEPRLESYDPETKEGEFKIAPAKWIWLPSERTLPCTFVLFRKEFELTEVPKIARGWIAADSRYILYVNGNRVQFGPAPHDPRHAEADPVDIAAFLVSGKNVIGIHVLFYGQGDGTWPTGKPGMMFRVNVGKFVVVTDKRWKCCVDRAHRPGRPKRWYLRALQEEYDAKLFPHGWNLPDFKCDYLWYDSMELETSIDQAAFSSSYKAYNEDVMMLDPKRSTITPRSIPMMIEEVFKAKLLKVEAVSWSGNPNDWFDFRVPDLVHKQKTTRRFESDYNTNLDNSPNFLPGSYLLTYALPREMVGFPILAGEFQDNCIVELMCQESHDPEQLLMDTHFHSWTRFITSPIQKRYECFDYECCKFIQLHLDVPRGGRASDLSVFFRSRRLLSQTVPTVDFGQGEVDADLRKLLLACNNTLLNSAQDIVVDGMARERQQYAGDGATQLHAVRLAHGQCDLSRRFLKQFGYGQMKSGIWFDSWPAYDRYARLSQRHIDATGWGSIVDHSIGFVMEHVHHWLQTGDREPYEWNEAAIRRFEEYLLTITNHNGLLKVEDIGTETVWIDHDAYHSQADKKLAFNLYHMQMKVMLGWLRGEEVDLTTQIGELRGEFWCERRKVLVNNLQEAAHVEERYCDRSIHHLLWLHANGFEVAPSLNNTIQVLSQQPKSLGIGYPVNSVWRHWAWTRIGRVDLVLKELREVWSKMYSVENNQTIQEMWNVKPGTTSLMSHCGVVPTIDMHTSIFGIGHDRDGMLFLRPQLGDLDEISIETMTQHGCIALKAKRQGDTHVCEILKPYGMPLVLRTSAGTEIPNLQRGKETETDLQHSSREEFIIRPYPRNSLIVDNAPGE